MVRGSKQCEELYQRPVAHDQQTFEPILEHSNHLVMEASCCSFPAKIQTAIFKSTNVRWCSYSGTSLRANVAYDTFLGSCPSCSQAYEVMIWLGVYGGVSPLSDNGYPSTPVATPTIGGTAFNLIKGHNGNVIVYSFVAQSGAATGYSGDLLAFYKYLETSWQLSSGQYLQTIQAGTEVFTGSGAKLTTSAYTIKVN
ncbi:MAG: hypothetical protein Q9190_001162 [Brigantiaea leucoxantha]